MKLINLGEVSSGRGFARARFRHLVYEIIFTRVWATFRQLVDDELDEYGQGFASVNE